MNTLEQQIEEILKEYADIQFATHEYRQLMSKKLIALIKQRESEAYMKGLTDRLEDVSIENIIQALRQDTNFMRMLGTAAIETFLLKEGEQEDE